MSIELAPREEDKESALLREACTETLYVRIERRERRLGTKVRRQDNDKYYSVIPVSTFA